MAEQFKDQRAAAGSSPSALKRWLGSRVTRRLTSLERRSRSRRRAENKRLAQGRPHRVEYFHQVEDAYSHLAVQLLRALADRYDIELVAHLAGGPSGRNAPEPELLLDYARYDCGKIAPQYHLSFPESAPRPGEEAVALAARILAAVDRDDFARAAVAVGEAMWAGDMGALAALQNRWGSRSDAQARGIIAQGSARRDQLGHYSGAMFYYEGEWYWGVDRLYHLENRLLALGAGGDSDRQLLAPRPAIEEAQLKDDGRLTLEFYLSLRSPYTSIIYDLSLQMARDMQVGLAMRPVMPMVMRGVPLTRNKGVYIIRDVAREAATWGLDWGKIYDPIGDPVRKGFSLYPYALKQGKGDDFLRAFLQAAWFKGINTNSMRGLRWVVEEAGLNWQQARPRILEPGWEALLEANRLAMYEFGLWGVPSYRLLDEQGRVHLAVWGQDRLWLVAKTIQNLLRQRQSNQSAA